MEPNSLNPADLVVTSFEVSSEYSTISPITINDPTNESRCFVCPVYTDACY